MLFVRFNECITMQDLHADRSLLYDGDVEILLTLVLPGRLCLYSDKMKAHRTTSGYPSLLLKLVDVAHQRYVKIIVFRSKMKVKQNLTWAGYRLMLPKSKKQIFQSFISLQLNDNYSWELLWIIILSLLMRITMVSTVYLMTDRPPWFEKVYLEIDVFHWAHPFSISASKKKIHPHWLCFQDHLLQAQTAASINWMYKTPTAWPDVRVSFILLPICTTESSKQQQ